MGKFLKIFFGIIGGIVLLALITAAIILIKMSDGRDINNKKVVEDNKPLSRVIDNKLYEATYQVEANNDDAILLFNEEEQILLIHSKYHSISFSQIVQRHSLDFSYLFLM